MRIHISLFLEMAYDNAMKELTICLQALVAASVFFVWVVRYANIVQEFLLRLAPFLPTHPTVDHHQRIGSPEQQADLSFKVVERIAMFGEEDQLLPW